MFFVVMPGGLRCQLGVFGGNEMGRGGKPAGIFYPLVHSFFFLLYIFVCIYIYVFAKRTAHKVLDAKL